MGKMTESIIIYGRAGCSKCNIVKDFLHKNKVEFQYVDIESIPMKESDKIINIATENGIFGLPIVNKNGIYIKDIKEIVQ
jgi:glutaredoxin